MLVYAMLILYTLLITIVVTLDNSHLKAGICRML